MLIIRLHLRSAGKAKLESRGTPVESPRSTIKRMTVTFDYHVLPPKIKTSDYRVTESVINVLPAAFSQNYDFDFTLLLSYVPSCLFCCQKESVHHLFFECVVAKQLW